MVLVVNYCLWHCKMVILLAASLSLVSDAEKASAFIHSYIEMVQNRFKSSINLCAHQYWNILIPTNLYSVMGIEKERDEKYYWKCTLHEKWLLFFQAIKAFLPSMIENNYGHIVSINSMLGLIGLKGTCDYSISKFAATGEVQESVFFCISFIVMVLLAVTINLYGWVFF